jgi:sugar lactone lactonase YvrE
MIPFKWSRPPALLRRPAAALVALAAAALAANLYAVETRFWQHDDQSDFEKGTFENISLRSDGHMFLAPTHREVFDSSVPYLWAGAADSKGNLYVGGGGSGSGKSKLFEISRDGKTRTVTELDGLEIHAIAVDSHGQIYAGTDPDGKIYKVSPDGNCRMFYDPKAKYIWGMAFDSSGNLFVATGDQGEIHKVSPDGKGSVFFRTEETHARSLAIDSNNNLIVGTEPNGLILRITPAGSGFVLYQARKREITSVAVSPAGAIYAAGVGTRSTTPSVPPPPVPIPSPTPTTKTSGTQSAVQSTRSAMAANPPASFTPASVSGGSDLYRIDPDGEPRRVWANSQDIVYAIAFDANGSPLLGTGNGGKVYRLDSDVLSTQLLNLAPTQVTSFAKTSDGRLFAITGNIGKVYQVGPGYARTGKYESDALDAGSFAYWGRISVRGSTAGIAVRTRSGNLNRPVNNWSAWTAETLQPMTGELSARVTSPSARFLQYEITLSAPNGSSSQPDISSVTIAYLTKNVAPVVQAIDITPANYKFPTQSLTLTPSTSITLPPMGQKRTTSTQPVLDLGTAETLSYAKGYLGARWMAHDANGDALLYKVEIRGRGETDWKLLKDKIKDKEISFDSTAFPDGEYELRVTASDAPSNPPGQALTASLVSDPFLIDNTPPQITGLAATPAGNRVEVHWRAHDDRSIIDHAEYSVNGSDWLMAEPVGRLSDSPDEEYRIAIDKKPGEQTIAVRVTDEYDNQTVDKVVIK